MKVRCYSELKKLETIEDRYNYLKIPGVVGKTTLGFDRYLGQKFYRSIEWQNLRHFVIIRDNGCDLGIPGFEVYKNILIHHMNPIKVEDLMLGNLDILDPEFLITTCHDTHLAIHYGDKNLLPQIPIERKSGDTCPWHPIHRRNK